MDSTYASPLPRAPWHRLWRWLWHLRPDPDGHAELTGADAAILRDIGLTPEEFLAARAAEHGAPGRARFDS